MIENHNFKQKLVNFLWEAIGAFRCDVEKKAQCLKRTRESINR